MDKEGKRMKLDGTKIIIESRREIDLLQDMIDLYTKNNKDISESAKRELLKLKGQLEGLWFCW